MVNPPVCFADSSPYTGAPIKELLASQALLIFGFCTAKSPSFHIRIKKSAPLGADFALSYFFERYSSIDFAASLPAPIAEITVAAPVTASPPA